MSSSAVNQTFIAVSGQVRANAWKADSAPKRRVTGITYLEDLRTSARIRSIMMCVDNQDISNELVADISGLVYQLRNCPQPAAGTPAQLKFVVTDARRNYSVVLLSRNVMVNMSGEAMSAMLNFVDATPAVEMKVER